MENKKVYNEIFLLLSDYLGDESLQQKLEDNQPLNALLDSFSLLSFLMELESKYGLVLPEQVFYDEEKQTLSVLAGFIEKGNDLVSNG